MLSNESVTVKDRNLKKVALAGTPEEADGPLPS